MALSLSRPATSRGPIDNEFMDPMLGFYRASTVTGARLGIVNLARNCATGALLP